MSLWLNCSCFFCFSFTFSLFFLFLFFGHISRLIFSSLNSIGIVITYKMMTTSTSSSRFNPKSIGETSNIEQFRHAENICQLQQQRSNPIKSERLVCKMEPIWWRNHFKSMHHYSIQLSCWVSRIGYRMCSSFSHLVFFFFFDFFFFWIQ